MKTKYFTKIVILALLVSVFSCDSDEEAEILENRDTAGLIINLDQSSGALLGSPDGLPVETSPVTVTDAYLNLEVLKISGSMEGVSKIEVVKVFNGDGNDGSNETTVVETTSLPLSFQYDSLDGFLEGTGLTVDDLRIGDSFTFRVKVHQTDGNVYYYGNVSNPLWIYKLTLNCASDLSGTYTMTNSVCASTATVTISQNPDGTWLISNSDGGLLQYCSTNDFPNPGSIAIGCGGVVSSAVQPLYCTASSYGIGCIVDGSWDQGAGVLTMNHTNAFFTWAPAEYTSTYVRQ